MLQHKKIHPDLSALSFLIDRDQADVQLEILGYSKEGGK